MGFDTPIRSESYNGDTVSIECKVEIFVYFNTCRFAACRIASDFSW